MIERERVRPLNDRIAKGGRYVIYWMQASQRTRYNHALNYASMMADDLGVPLIVFFGLKEDYPSANLRHFTFMLQGLSGVSKEMEEHGVKFVLRRTSPEKGIMELLKDAALIVCDRGYLRHQRQWRAEVAARAGCPVIMVESDAVVPADLVSDREMYSAAVIRPRIMRLLHGFLVIPEEHWPRKGSMDLEIEGAGPKEIERLRDGLRTDRSVPPVKTFKGGEMEAEERLEHFLSDRLERYEEYRNDPSMDLQSDLSPYLHFGQISPLYIAFKALHKGSRGTDKFLDELIIRRELSINFVLHCPEYDSFDCLPGWARTTLIKHRSDRREHLYSVEELENARTHDPYWNAAQVQMVRTGKMHGYMRMYWGKKILEWTADPWEAFRTALYLNDRYSLDGRDPNSYAGIAWCFGKHDRPWGERSIFGTVRYMNDKGLKRKFEMGPYVKKWVRT